MNTYVQHTKQISYDYLYDKAPTSEERKQEYYCHMHNDYELLFFFDGNIDYIIENSQYHLNKNDLLLIKPMTLHGANILSPQPYERIVINFNRLALPESYENILKDLGSVYHIQNGSPIYNLFYNLRACEKFFNEEEFTFLKTSTLYNAIANLHYLSSEEFEETHHNLLDDIIKYIQENPELPLTSQVLANKFYVSKSWIDHNFKTHLNLSPKQYINQKKILYAQSLILSGESISEVVERCNYVNYTTFYRQYKSILNKEPQQDKLPTTPHNLRKK